MSITVQPGIAKQAVIMKRRVGERIAEYVGISQGASCYHEA